MLCRLVHPQRLHEQDEPVPRADRNDEQNGADDFRSLFPRPKAHRGEDDDDEDHEPLEREDVGPDLIPDRPIPVGLRQRAHVNEGDLRKIVFPVAS